MEKNSYSPEQQTIQGFIYGDVKMTKWLFLLLLAVGISTAKADVSAQAKQTAKVNNDRNAFFGDLHVHTSWSLDSYIFSNTNGPREALLYAMGKPVAIAGDSNNIHQLKIPLDFVAITDHAESFAYTERCLLDADNSRFDSATCKSVRERELKMFYRAFKTLALDPPQHLADVCENKQSCRESAKNPWKEMQRLTEKYNQPGKFTTLHGFEFTPNYKGGGGSVHRNIIFANSSVTEEAMSVFDLPSARELWAWLEENCIGDCDAITIPHNSNISWGKHFALSNTDGSQWSNLDYSRRAKFDRLAEIHQGKGNSECYLGIGTQDEFCNFELIYDPCKEGQVVGCVQQSSMLRNGLKTGLKLEKKLGFNPFAYGIIASTDTHNGNPGGTMEKGYPGHQGKPESTAVKRLTGGLQVKKGRGSVTYNPGGLAGVWASNNTRNDIYSALKRRETFGTSGNRIRIRMFAGWDLDKSLANDNDWSSLYTLGVPMGGTLLKTAKKRSLSLLVWAARDPQTAPLQRLQVIKGWLDDKGTVHEQTFDVACSDGLSPDPDTHRCPDNGAKVDSNNCEISQDKGATQLSVVWQDPNFNPEESAFYYTRALENPSCRWSTYDLLATKRKVKPAIPVAEFIQERAWGSPVWYKPD
jgi:hypothetical protein